LPVAIYTCNNQGFIQFYNKAATALWGREPQIGTDLWCGSWKIYQSDGTTPVSLDDCPMAVTLKEGRPIRGTEIIIERPDGIRRNVLPHPDPIFDENGVLVGAVNMLVDITEHKQIQAANLQLRTYNEQLEQFAYAASHDMQEPLRKIQVYSSMLLEKNYEQLNEQGKNFLTRINRSTERMNSILQDLLSYSRETKVQERYSEIDLNKTMENITSDLELMINDKKAHVRCDGLPIIKGVASQINRLFYNLIHNTLKFSKPGRPPLIHIYMGNHFYAGPHGKTFFEIRVSDNGIGFEPKHSDRIFHLFQRLNGKEEYEGNGIGLALCKKIVEMHKGQISAESELDKGATFHIKLPVELLQ
jgi:light-regulated signal transduction histidine kinase (bacteriophytochrome)